jgi:carboxysome shell carbonic anhydrase
MPSRSRQSLRSRTATPRGRSVRVRAWEQPAPAPVQPVAQAEQPPPEPAARREVRRPATPGPTRPTRPPRPQPPGLAALKRMRSVANSGGLSLAPQASAESVAAGAGHPLTNHAANGLLAAYEQGVKSAFDRIVPVLKDIASHRCEQDFTEQASRVARRELGLELPDWLLGDAWVTGLDMRRLFAWVLFATYHRVSDEFFTQDPLGGREGVDFQAFLLDCGFHLMDVTPCADGRLAHAISYVLRLPYGAVRRKSYAGALFDIENTVEKWVETELMRFREGVPNTADAPSRYLKTVLYHFSSGDPSHQGCAAHGSDDAAAARAGWERLQGFRQAVENGFCCGASVDLLLIGLDTDTDAIRVHVPDAQGNCGLESWLDANQVYDETRSTNATEARRQIAAKVRSEVSNGGSAPSDGMVALIGRLLENNISQIDYVRTHHGGRYQDIGHAERFIGAGVGFEEIQLRNLTYFAYLDTVEEGAPDLDVGMHIFSGLNLVHGLPVPVVVRYDYHGQVPGARERAVAHCERIASALAARYPDMVAKGQLHCLRVVRDCDAAAPIEIVGSSLEPQAAGGH